MIKPFDCNYIDVINSNKCLINLIEPNRIDASELIVGTMKKVSSSRNMLTQYCVDSETYMVVIF